MLNDLFQKSHDRHRALPLLGPVLDDFDDWLFEQGYRHSTRQCYALRCTAIEEYFWRRKQRSLWQLTPEKLRKCWQFYYRRPGGIANTVTCLQRFLQSRQIACVAPSSTPFSAIVDAYRKHLTEVRGLASSTIAQHCLTASEFLQYALQDGALRLVDLTQAQVESFITAVSPRFGRGSLQHVVAQIRGLLRFLAMRGEAPPGLGAQIDMPRVYRLEQLPHALPWPTVCAFLETINREDACGLRDYAMFLLIATYGLRGCDIAGLKLNDIDWRADQVQINQSKTRKPLRLPLTDPVAEALFAYLCKGRRHSSYRELFLTVQAPVVPLKRQSPGYAFRFRVAQSGWFCQLDLAHFDALFWPTPKCVELLGTPVLADRQIAGTE